MFNLTTILALIAPAVIGPLACFVLLHFIERAESDRQTPVAPASPAQAAVDAQIALDPGAAPAPAKQARERTAA